MNPPDLENEFRALRPAQPSEGLRERIASELAAPLPAPRAPWFSFRSLFRNVAPPLGWATAGAAATFVMLAETGRLTPQQEPAESAPFAAAPSAFEQVETTRQLVSAIDEGVFFAETGEPARRIRTSSIERRAWANPVTGARLEVELPREDVFLTSLAIQ